eukprot:gb/GEZN01016529.1/.p3 GENE.gb/GEZN01016529.1/~~gb/GEZN01016529.1/.p3  ORF type:complete len:115 (+),score=2.95 gb/GEZN01016529.1/:3-347(+)
MDDSESRLCCSLLALSPLSWTSRSRRIYIYLFPLNSFFPFSFHRRINTFAQFAKVKKEATDSYPKKANNYKNYDLNICNFYNRLSLTIYAAVASITHTRVVIGQFALLVANTWT